SVAMRIRSARPVQPKTSAGVLVRATARARAGKPIRATVSLPQLSVVHLALQADSGEVALTPDRTYGPGSARLKGHLPPLASGTYGVVAVVTNGIDIVRTPARRLVVAGS